MAASVDITINAQDNASSVFGGFTVTLGDVMNIAGKVIGAVSDMFSSTVKAAEEQQDVAAQLEAGLKSTGGAAGVTMQQMQDLAEAQSKVTDFSKLQTEAIEKVALTFTSVNKDIFPQTISLSEDMAQRLGIQGSQAMTMIGKAMDDPIKGMGALHRVGVSFTDQQKDQIKALVAAGDTMGAQKILLGELSKEYGGSATAAGATFAGQQAILAHQFDEVKEKIGTALLPVLGQLTGMITSNVLPVVQEFAQWFSDNLPGAIAYVSDTVIPKLLNAWQSIAPVFDSVRTIVQAVVDEFAFALDLDPGAWSGNWIGTFQEIGTIVNTLLEPALTAVGRGLQALGGYVNTAMASFTQLGASVNDNGFPQLEVILRSIGGQIQTIFSDSEGPIHGFLSLFDQISPSFEVLHAVVATAIPSIKMIVTEAFGIIQGFLQEHGAKILNDVGGAWKKIQDILHDVIPPIQTIVNQVFGAVASFLHDHGADIQATLGQTWDRIAKIVSTALDLIQAIVPPVLNAIAAYIKTHGAAIQAILSATWTAIKAVIDIALTLIQGVITIALDLIHGNWQKAWEDIKTMSATIVTDLITIVKADLDILKTIFADAIKWISDEWKALPKQLSDVGNAIVKTIQEGFEIAWENFKASALKKLQEFRDKLPFSEPKDSSSPLYGLGKSGAAIVANMQQGIDASPKLTIGGVAVGRAGSSSSAHAVQDLANGSFSASGGGDTHIYNIDARNSKMSQGEFKKALTDAMKDTGQKALSKQLMGN